MDSGASYHFTMDINDFDTLEDDDTEVSLGDGSVVKIKQKGSVKVRVEGVDLTLTNVKYMPSAEFCILSPGYLTEKGAKVIFYNGGVDIFLNNRCIAQGQQIRTLYWVSMQSHFYLAMDDVTSRGLILLDLSVFFVARRSQGLLLLLYQSPMGLETTPNFWTWVIIHHLRGRSSWNSSTV